MLTWIWIGVIAIAVIGGYLLIRQNRNTLRPTPITPELAPLERTVFSLQIGDIVQYLDTDWFVEGKLTYNSSGYTWLEYLLQDQDRIRWLSVEEDDQVEVSFLEPVQGLDIPGTPPNSLPYNGVTYQLDESGTAQMTREGSTLNRQGEFCHYYDYQGPSGERLSIEDWGDEREVTQGKRIRPSALTLLPGDGRHVYGM